MLTGRAIYSLMFNTTAIEEWEIERHEVLLRRARINGGYLEGPEGVQIRIKRQEFPFDIGIWQNITQGMGTSFVSDSTSQTLSDDLAVGMVLALGLDI
jgi:palmitoyltransferase